MEHTFNIRKFNREDLDQVMYINQICLPENYSSYFFIDLHMNFPEAFLIAEENGKIIGYVTCRIEGGFSGLGITKRGHVISIAVLPGYRRRGIGQALLKEALYSMATHYGVKECYLEVRVSNMPAINLYRKMGFKIERTIRGYYADGENAYIMRVKL